MCRQQSLIRCTHMALPCMSRLLQGLVLPTFNGTQAVLLQALEVAVPAVACPARLGLPLGLLLEARRDISDAGEGGGGKHARRGRITSRLDASGVWGRVRLDTLACSMQTHSTRFLMTTTKTPLHLV